MDLQKIIIACQKSRFRKNTNLSCGTGFSIVELVVTIGIFSLIVGITIPVGLDSYLNYILVSEVRNFVSLVRRAEVLSLANDYGVSHGIAAQADRYVIFYGPSYAGRNQAFDEIYPRAGAISIATTTEIIFTPISGIPNAPATIVLSNGTLSNTITVNGQGAINW